ncbi:M23 family metallopeptidase [Geodermatophilus marinus]|uniref:M23 family metallopeptidase n=1 Tax=Geodermatophilus sp. LHW52908 TaxID=2303986 RepID=UPI000E3DC66B|nr:M23 family metallopeptidase [Geodermatophilus sp. LHW52908]RFU22988.1 M23 family peptidase [Geodermatophilus sp. LHW52908]
MIRTAVAGTLAPVLVAAGLLTAVLVLDARPAGCAPAGGSLSVTGVPGGEVAGWSGEQLANAAAIVQAGAALGVGARGQVVGVMTAMGESSLTVLDHGDAVGPDSRGLFQQRDNGAWGSYADRMDPATSAANFFRALLRVENWDQLPPTIAAHRTQRNADPWHYARWWDDALAVVGALTGGRPDGLAPGTGSVSCTGAAPVLRAVTGGWTSPSEGPITSGFGLRDDPTGDGTAVHAGLDLAPGCDAPIVAAATGVVVRAGAASGYGNLVVVDHGGGVVTRYAHMADDGLLVVVGQPVVAGQQVARVGSEGDSTGCHLHFEVLLDGVPTDPLAFLTDRGLDPR